MANTAVNSQNVVTRFLSDYFREYVRNNQFSRYTGTSPMMPIVIKEGRQKISIPLVTRLKGQGVSGSTRLRGNGEQIGNYAHELKPTYYRWAAEFDREELEKPNIDLMNAARPLLMDWSMELTRNHIIQAMAAVFDGTTYSNYANASEAVKDAWLANNSDRVLFGSARSNNAANDHSAALANIDASADTLTMGVVSLAKRMAKTADPRIRPVRVKDTAEFHVMFVGSRAYRDFFNSTGYQANLQMAMERGKSNPLFQPGDLFHDNTLIREVPEITTLLTESPAFATAGNGGIPVEPCFLCGAQAIGFGLGQRPRIIIDKKDDYEFQPGVAVELKHDIQKLFFNNKQNGMVTVYVAGVPDA
jgi:hypothetical protein